MTADAPHSLPSTDLTDFQWTSAALLACREPSRAVVCPACGAEAVRAEWNIVSVISREADAELKCESCSAPARVRFVLPLQAPEFVPVARLASITSSVDQELTEILNRVREREQLLPAAAWMMDPLWWLSGWSATTFRWHPTSGAPPIMGLVFETAEAGKQLFRNWTERWGNADELEEIRIAIIEGDVPGQEPGYSVHICPDPENSLVRATAEGLVINDIPFASLGQTRRMHPPPGQPPLLLRFKREFETRQEFLLAPVTRREDGQLWVDVESGIVKTAIHLRQVADIGEGDIDEVLLRARFCCSQ